MFERALDSHPEGLIVAVGVAALLLVIAIAFALDVFIGAGVRDDDVSDSLPVIAPLPSAVELMRAHAAIVRRHVAARLCAARGHDAVLVVERGRVVMRCSSCGHESPGWEVA